jgi:aminoglycoside phosphotransferase (APT) family kinase protein
MTELRPGRRIGEGREAEIFELDEGRVLRLMRKPQSTERSERQAAAMRAAVEAGVPTPEPYEVVVVDGRPGIVMDRVDGPALMTVLARAPWKLFSVARMLGEVHAQLHQVVAPASVPEQRAVLRERILAADALPKRFVDPTLAALERLPEGDRLCHGDFHISNVLVGSAGPAVIDWNMVARGHPTADLARSLLLTRIGEVPPGTPRMIRIGRAAGQGFFLRAYERTYRLHAPVDDASLPDWQAAHVAARFYEGIESEYPALTRFLESYAAR